MGSLGLRRLFLLGGLFLGCLLLAGCSSDTAETVSSFQLDTDRQQAYTTEISNVLMENYWHFDLNSLTFSQGEVPNDPTVWAASARSGYNLEAYSGGACVVGSLALTYYDEQSAGTCSFYFDGDKLLGVCYQVPDAAATAYALSDRSPYPAGLTPDAAESTASYGDLSSYPIQLSDGTLTAAGTAADGTPLVCLLSADGVEVYRVEGKSTRLFAALTLEGERPIAAAFLPEGRFALLSGTYEANGEEDAGRLVPRTLTVYDGTLTQVLASQSGENCTGLAASGDKLLVSQGKTLKFYQLENGALTLVYRQYLGHPVTDLAVGDLTGTGSLYYFMESGLDCYLYRQDTTQTNTALHLVWQTHVNGSFFLGPVSIGDLNGDGVQEIYLLDQDGSAIRYTLGQWSLVTQNQDISYGEVILAADLNGDGQSDCIRRTADGSAALCLRED